MSTSSLVIRPPHPRRAHPVSGPQCSGATPQCERCEKRGVKCEYIPCSQQKASSSSPKTPPSMPEHLMHHPAPPHYFASQSLRTVSPATWHPNAPAYQGYLPDAPHAFEHPPDWQNQVFGIPTSNAQVPPGYFGDAATQQRPPRSIYSGEDFDQATYSYQAYGQGALAPQNISSHPEYADGAFPSGYAAPDVYTGPSDPSLSYGYGGHHGRTTAQAHLPSQRS